MNSAKSQHNLYEPPTMSSIQDYRRQLEQQVAEEQAHSQTLRWGAELESRGAMDELGSSRSIQSDPVQSDLNRLQAAVVGPNVNPDPAFRAAALGEIVARSELANAQQLPLERLADAEETVQVRLAALGILKVLAISSPTFSEWRPAYLEALRSAIAESELRIPALSALIAQGDRYAQELLVTGLENPEQALVDPAEALNLLSEDPHADVRELARQFVDGPPNEQTLQAAIRHLAGDPSSVDRLRNLIIDPQQTVTARKLAATALNVLSPDSLPVPNTSGLATRDIQSADAEIDPVEEFVRILASQRRRP
jgi:hypothetical protein